MNKPAQAPLTIPGPALIGFDHVFTGTQRPSGGSKCPHCGGTLEPTNTKNDGMMGLDFLGL